MRFIGAGGVQMFSNPVMKVLVLRNNTNSNTDLNDEDTGSAYTIPSGKQFCMLSFSAWNSGSTTYKLYEDNGGTLTIFYNQTAATGNTGAGWLYCVDQNLKISVTPSNTASNIWVQGVECDRTSAIHTVKLSPVPTGTTTIYTVPASSHAFIVGKNGQDVGGNQTDSSVEIINDTANTPNESWFIVPSGGSAGSTNQIVTAGPVGANTSVAASLHAAPMSAGDFFAVTMSAQISAASSTSNMYINIISDTGTH